MNAPTPPGWHRDPWATAQWRWFDGTAWTGHVAGGATAGASWRVDPGGVSTRPVPPAPPSGAPVPPGAPTRPPPPAGDPGVIASIGRMLGSAGSGGEQAAEEHRGRYPLPTQQRSGQRTGRARILSFAAVGLFVVVLMTIFVTNVVADPDSRDITQDPTPPYWRFVMLAAALGAGGVAVWLWRRRFMVVDTPTVEISGAHPGLCELTGHARPLRQPTMTWFCGAPAIWWDAKVEQRRGTGKNRRWVTEWKSRGGHKSFQLVDEHGASIEVSATGAQFNGQRTLLTRSIGNRRRITETALVSGDHLYLLGPVRITGDGRLRVQKDVDPHGPEAGMADVRRRLPLWLFQGDEAGVARGLLAFATIATIVAIVGVAAFTALDTETDRFGRDTLVVRDEGALLVPALAAGGSVAVAFVVGYAWRLWNRLVELRWQAAHAWSLIEVAVVARSGLIANLVATTRAGAAHERAAFVAGATGRGGLPGAVGVAAVDGTVAAENRQRAALVAQVEAHPDLGAGTLFTELFTQLVATENRLAASRRFYNDAVTVLADRTGTLPGALLKPLVAPVVPPLLAFELHTARAPSIAPAPS